MQMLYYFTNFKGLLPFVPNVHPESMMVSLISSQKFWTTHTKVSDFALKSLLPTEGCLIKTWFCGPIQFQNPCFLLKSLHFLDLIQLDNRTPVKRLLNNWSLVSSMLVWSFFSKFLCFLLLQPIEFPCYDMKCFSFDIHCSFCVIQKLVYSILITCQLVYKSKLIHI